MQKLPNNLTAQAIRKELAKRKLSYFATFNNPIIKLDKFHEIYYEILTLFALGTIKNLIITMPPQHGKSEGSTRNLPAFIFGLKPDCKIAIASYNDTFASKFNKDVQRIIDSTEYNSIFPETTLDGSKYAKPAPTSHLRNGHEFEIVGKRGTLKSVGRGGALTGSPVDVGILDDMYKDAMEANSVTIRESAWEWYTKVFMTRLHNDSQQLIVFTRWHQDDIIGRLERENEVVTITDLEQIKSVKKDAWVKLNFEAIKESEPTKLDQRGYNDPLWPSRHSLEKLLGYRKLDPNGFDSLYQGNPTPKEGVLYSEFGTYNEIKEPTISDICIVDVADKGTDYLCAIWYKKGVSGLKYVYDVLYSPERSAKTIPEMVNKALMNPQQEILIESNAGGEGWAQQVKSGLHAYGKSRQIETYHQTLNKESKILTNAPTVNKDIIFPSNWESKWPKFATDVKGFLVKFNANEHDDAPDVLTEIVLFDNRPKRQTVRRLN